MVSVRWHRLPVSCEHAVLMRRVMGRVMLVVTVTVVAGCGSSSNRDDNGNGGDEVCEVDDWVSTSMTVPAQAGLSGVTPTGGGDGIALSFRPDGTFLADFGPMQPALSSFESAGQTGELAVAWGGVGSGRWSADDSGVVSATIDDLSTVRAAASFTLGVTTPPIFDATLEQLGTSMMLDATGLGVLTVTGCTQEQLTLSTPFPGGDVVIQAERSD
jgi:hypothetical protein